jgi:vesicle-associated membrane protein 4
MNTLPDPVETRYKMLGNQYLRPGPTTSFTTRTSKIQAEIDEATIVMKENLMKTAERGERIDSLEQKSQNISAQAGLLRRGANRVRKRMCIAEMKARAWLFLGLLILLLFVAGGIAAGVKALSG